MTLAGRWIPPDAQLLGPMRLIYAICSLAG